MPEGDHVQEGAASRSELLSSDGSARWVKTRAVSHPAIEVAGLSVETITRVTKLDLADSALHAPAEHAVLAVAAGEWDEKRTADRLRPLLAGPTA